MFPSGQHQIPTVPTVPTEFFEQILDANRAAAKLLLDVYEQALESIATLQEQAASQTDVEWIANAAAAQARFTRELASHHVSVGRELLK